MIIDQISIFLENKSGTLLDITDLLAKESVNIIALSLADTSDFGILRLIVNDANKVLEILKKNNITSRSSQVIATDVLDEPGGLTRILKQLSKANVNIEYMYTYVEKNKDKTTLVFRTDDVHKAEQALV